MNQAQNQQQVDQDFEALEVLLTATQLDTEGQGKRFASPAEFMWMSEKHDHRSRSVGFKHRDTRNYVFVIFPQEEVGNKPILYVPKEFQPFMRGFFDAFPGRAI
jgi:hypothetical protein